MSGALFLLVDGLLKPDALRQLYARQENLDIEPLYMGTRWSQLKDKGPILVKASERLSQAWRSDADWRRCACLLQSRASMVDLARHLRRFLCPPDYLGNASLLRFADPLVLCHWLGSFDQSHRDRVLGPIDSLWVERPRQPWQPPHASAEETVQFAVLAPVTTWDPGFALQGQAQLDALEQAHDFLFQRRLYQAIHHEDPAAFTALPSAAIDAWLADALCSGRDWGLTSEFALATWAWYRHELGTDFIDVADGPYQTWLQLQPQCAELPPELRLDAFDQYRMQPAPQACEPDHD